MCAQKALFRQTFSNVSVFFFNMHRFVRTSKRLRGARLSNAAAAAAQRRAAATLPDRARVVVVGGGIIGTSIAYHLAKLGGKQWADQGVLLLDQVRACARQNKIKG